MFGFNRKRETIYMPVDGNVIELKEVSDPVFAQKMMGDGFAIIPTNDPVYSPVNGNVVSIFPTKHAIMLKTTNGVDVLIHIGIDTVTLEGEGFDSRIKEGQNVTIGDCLTLVDREYLKMKGKNDTIIIVFPEHDGDIQVEKTGKYPQGEIIGSIK